METKNNTTQEPAIPVDEPVKEITINEDKLNLYLEKLRMEQNLPMGIMVGLAASIGSALIWAAITVTTEYQIGYMAIAAGLIVGYAVRVSGKGLDTTFGIIGAGLAFLGCVLGNFFSIVGFVANAEGLGYLETLLMIDFAFIPELMSETFNPMDLLFYGIAIYEGYKFSFRQIDEEEIIQHAAE